MARSYNRRYQLTPMPSRHPKRWRKCYRGKLYYFPVKPGETKEDSYHRCLDEWKSLKTDLSRTTEAERIVFGALDAAEQDLRELESTVDRWQSMLNGEVQGSYVVSVSDELKAQAESKTASARAGLLAEMTARRFKEKLQHFVDWYGADRPVCALAESQVLIDYRNYLVEEITDTQKDRTAGGAATQMGAVLHFIRTAYVRETVPRLPKILAVRSKMLQFNSTAHSRKVTNRRDEANWHEDLETLRLLITTANPRTRLYLLLGLNCGYQQTDISELGQDEVDWKHGRIKRKRCKGERFANVPEVDYVLWKETFRLLKKFRAKPDASSNRKEQPRALVNRYGGPLVEVKSDTNNIGASYNRLVKELSLSGKKKKPFAALRKTSSTLLDHSIRLSNHTRNFSTISSLFLGQAPNGTTKRHYTPEDHKLLDEAIEWLGGQLQIDKAVSKARTDSDKKTS